MSGRRLATTLGVALATAAAVVLALIAGTGLQSFRAGQPLPTVSPPVSLPPPPVSPSPSPASSPTAAPSPTSAAARTHTNAQGRWSAEAPQSWRTHAWFSASSNAFTSYDPATASFSRDYAFESGLGPVPTSEIRVHVEVHDNPDRVDGPTWFDRTQGSPQSNTRTISRQTVTVAGQPALLLLQEEAIRDGSLRKLVRFVVAHPDRTTIYTAYAFPADSVMRGDFDRLMTSFRTSP